MSSCRSKQLYYEDLGSSIPVEKGGGGSDRRRVFRQFCIRKVDDACPGRGVEVLEGPLRLLP